MTKENTSLSFIIDYYDDFNETCIEYSGYKIKLIDNIGYHGPEPNGPFNG